MGEHVTYGNLARGAARLLLTLFGVIYRIRRSVGCARRDGGWVQKFHTRGLCAQGGGAIGRDRSALAWVPVMTAHFFIRRRDRGAGR